MLFVVRVAVERTSAHVAQSVEHFLGKEEVTGSNPVVGFQIFAPRKRRLFAGYN